MTTRRDEQVFAKMHACLTAMRFMPHFTHETAQIDTAAITELLAAFAPLRAIMRDAAYADLRAAMPTSQTGEVSVRVVSALIAAYRLGIVQRLAATKGA